MLKNESKQAVDTFLSSAKEEFAAFADQLSGEGYEAAASIILESQAKGGRLHITGIGKPGHVAAYMASLFSSTGNPCYFLHGTEAVHGSCGQLMSGDVVIAISNSGETGELKSTVLAVKNNGCKVIGVTGNTDSWLAQQSDACLFAGVKAEGGPLNRAPRNSILAEILMLQALSVAIQVEQDWDPIRYVRCHPGGALGQLRENEK
ncbi:MAG: SIS domain-containing protein [Oscillibacter sp.]|nr:SIS domain-containing protein [Oscillibacter sp.]